MIKFLFINLFFLLLFQKSDCQNLIHNFSFEYGTNVPGYLYGNPCGNQTVYWQDYSAQDTLIDSKAFTTSKNATFFSTGINSCVIWASPIYFLNPFVKFNNSQFGFYIGSAISEKLNINMSVTKFKKGSLTVPGFVAGFEFLLFDSLFSNKISLTINNNVSYIKYNYYGFSEFNYGGNWIDGPFNNKYFTSFIEISPSLLYKIHKRFFSLFRWV